MRHELKTDPEVFQAVWNGEKFYEIRKDDRTRLEQGCANGVGFWVNDELLLRETRYSGEQMAGRSPAGAPPLPLQYTGRAVLCRVTHKLSGPAYGLELGWCIMSIQRLDLMENRYGRKCHFTPQQLIEPKTEQAKLVEKAFDGLPGVEFKTQIAYMPPMVVPREEWENAPICRQEDGRNVHLLQDGRQVYGDLFNQATEPYEPKRPVAEWEKPADTPQRKFGHYFRACPYDGIDVYRVLEIFGVTSPAIQHAIKKLLVPGRRGAKDARKDMSEAVVSINRAIEMMDEDAAHFKPTGEITKS